MCIRDRDKGYIEDAVNQLGAVLESTLTQPTAQVEGQRPDLSGYEGETGQEQTPIIPENGQTLILRSGQPGRHLDTQALEDRILKEMCIRDRGFITCHRK